MRRERHEAHVERGRRKAAQQDSKKDGQEKAPGRLGRQEAHRCPRVPRARALPTDRPLWRPCFPRGRRGVPGGAEDRLGLHRLRPAARLDRLQAQRRHPRRLRGPRLRRPRVRADLHRMGLGGRIRRPPLRPACNGLRRDALWAGGCSGLLRRARLRLDGSLLGHGRRGQLQLRDGQVPRRRFLGQLRLLRRQHLQPQREDEPRRQGGHGHHRAHHHRSEGTYRRGGPLGLLRPHLAQARRHRYPEHDRDSQGRRAQAHEGVRKSRLGGEQRLLQPRGGCVRGVRLRR